MSLEELVNDYGLYLYRYALKLTCSPETAEDIVQETFLSAWKHIDSIQDIHAVKSWLRKICLNHFLMYYRKNANENLELCDDINSLEAQGHVFAAQFSSPEDEILVDDSIQSIQNGCFYAMVRKLNLHQRITFSLVDMFGLSTREVADLLELSEPATKGLLHRARMNLDSFFAGHCNILDAKNPCSCQSWINFRSTQEENKKNTRKLLESLDHNGDHYLFNQTVRNQIYFLYRNIPDTKPDSKWFEDIISSFRK